MIRNVIRDLGKLVLIGALGLAVDRVNAGVIKVTNATDSSVAISSFNVHNVLRGNEGFDAVDSPFNDPMQTNALLIYTNPYGTMLSVDARPVDTPGWSDIILSVKGNVNNN